MSFLVYKFPNQKMVTSKANITSILNEIIGSPDRYKLLGISRNVNEGSVLFTPSLGGDECSYLSRGGLSMNTGWCMQIVSRYFRVRRRLSKVSM